MKPIIGVSAAMDREEKRYTVSDNNLRALEQAGAIPVVLPYLSSSEDIDLMVEQLDGLYLTGGDDIDPIYFNEEPHLNLGSFNPKRDAFEINITSKILAKNKPVLGVCKGAQMLNLATHGDMYQDIYSQKDQDLYQHFQKAANHVPTHTVKLTEGSLIHQLIGKKEIRVNSFHHQANRKPGIGLIVSGKSSDGMVEVIEGPGYKFALGVQWHPEMLKNDIPSKKIYRGFVLACMGE